MKVGKLQRTESICISDDLEKCYVNSIVKYSKFC